MQYSENYNNQDFKESYCLNAEDHESEVKYMHDLEILTPALFGIDFENCRWCNRELYAQLGRPQKIGVSQVYDLLRIFAAINQMTQEHLMLKQACELWFESSNYYYRYEKQY